MRSFRGKTAAITGAGSGIGRALAIRLAGHGCGLSLSDVDAEGLAATAALAGPGVRITTAVVDVAAREQVFGWAEETARAHGAVHLAINNAGVALGASAEGARLADFEWLMNVNFWGVVHGTQAFLPYLRASGEGHVINVSSALGLVAVAGQSAYAASKFAVRGFTECLRQELELTRAPVSATCVHPGGIRTNIARSARMTSSLQGLGVHDPASAQRRFDRLLRTSADDAAAAILHAVRSDARRVLVGADARLLDLLQRLFPSGYQRAATALARRLLR